MKRNIYIYLERRKKGVLGLFGGARRVNLKSDVTGRAVL